MTDPYLRDYIKTEIENADRAVLIPVGAEVSMTGVERRIFAVRWQAGDKKHTVLISGDTFKQMSDLDKYLDNLVGVPE